MFEDFEIYQRAVEREGEAAKERVAAREEGSASSEGSATSEPAPDKGANSVMLPWIEGGQHVAKSVQGGVDDSNPSGKVRHQSKKQQATSAGAGIAGGSLDIWAGIEKIREGKKLEGGLGIGKGTLSLADVGLNHAIANADYGDASRASMQRVHDLGRLKKGLKWGGAGIDVGLDLLKIHEGFQQEETIDQVLGIGGGALGLGKTGLDLAGKAPYASALGLWSGGFQVASGLREGLKQDGDVDKAAADIGGGALGMGTSIATLAGAGALPVAAAGLAGYAGLKAGKKLREFGNAEAVERNWFGRGDEHLDRRFDKHNTDNSIDGASLRAGAWAEDQLDDHLPSWLAQGGGATAAAATGTLLTFGAPLIAAAEDLDLMDTREERAAELAAQHRARIAQRDEHHAEHREKFGAEALSEDEYIEHHQGGGLLGKTLADMETTRQIDAAREDIGVRKAVGNWDAIDQESLEHLGARTTHNVLAEVDRVNADPATEAAYREHAAQFGENAVSFDEFVNCQGDPAIAAEFATETAQKRERYQAHVAELGTAAVTWDEFRKTSPKKARRLALDRRNAATVAGGSTGTATGGAAGTGGER